MLEEEVVYLRSIGFDDIASMIADIGGAVPTARWLRERLRRRQRSHEGKYKQEHREERRQLDAKWREDHRQEFDALRLSRPIVVIDSEGQDYDGDAKS